MGAAAVNVSPPSSPLLTLTTGWCFSLPFFFQESSPGLWSSLCRRSPLAAAPTAAPAHQDIAVSPGELPEGFCDLLLCPRLLEVPIHSAILFLEKKGEPSEGQGEEEPGGRTGVSEVTRVPTQ